MSLSQVKKNQNQNWFRDRTLWGAKFHATHQHYAIALTFLFDAFLSVFMQNVTFGAAFRFLNFNLHTFWLSITCENRVIRTTEVNINHNDSTKNSTDGVVDCYGEHTAAAVRRDVDGASILGLTTRDHSNVRLWHNIERFE